MIVFPHGYPAVLRTYGDPRPYVEDKLAWEALVLVTRPLRYPLPYAYLRDTMITKIRAHRLVVDVFVEALAKCIEARVSPARIAYGGCYVWRAQRGAEKLSLHTWGVAMDLDPARNPLGKRWDGGAEMIPATAIEIFETLGLVSGVRWARVDAMHVQAADGV